MKGFHEFGSPLTIALGRDVSGQAVVADLASMPHLLIAGTTGSGKSVSIAALTTCLVMNNTPEDLRIVMIDPKMVELVRFNHNVASKHPEVLQEFQDGFDRWYSSCRESFEGKEYGTSSLEKVRQRWPGGGKDEDRSGKKGK